MVVCSLSAMTPLSFGSARWGWWQALSVCAFVTTGLPSTHWSANAGVSATFSVLDFGGVGDGTTMNTRAFASAMNAAHSSWHTSGQPSILVAPAPGVYLSGQIVILSGVSLSVAPGARLKASANVSDYPSEAWAFLYSKGATDFGVTGALVGCLVDWP